MSTETITAGGSGQSGRSGAARRRPTVPVWGHATAESRRHLLLLLLALNSGAVDAIGLAILGGVFTSVMTGNMIFFGTSLAGGDGNTALRSVMAIVLFMAGSYVGARVTGRPVAGGPVWPPEVSRALLGEFCLGAVFAGCWWGAGAHPGEAMQWVMLGVDAVALGLQSSAILRFGVSGLSTTYMTGTLTTLVAALAHGQHPRHVASSMRLLTALVAGAVIALLVVRHAHPLVPLLTLVPVGLTLLLARTVDGSPAPARETT